MALIKISELTEETTPADGDFIPIVDVSTNSTKKATRTNIFKNPPLADTSITPKMLQTGTGSSWAWQTWTPSLVNLSGGTLTYSKYIQIGKTVNARFLYTLAGAGVAGDVTVTLPVTASSNYSVNGEILGSVYLRDNTGTDYPGVVQLTSTTIVTLRYIAPGITALSSTVPFTWATSDNIGFEITYEAA